jgi:hypothetical protein
MNFDKDQEAAAIKQKLSAVGCLVTSAIMVKGKAIPLQAWTPLRVPGG